MALTVEDLIASLNADLEGPQEDPIMPAAGTRTLAYYQRLLDTAVGLIERYAPAAPEAVKDEAATRAAGYLHEHTWSAMSQVGDSGKLVSFSTASVSALRHSGAMGILTFWKRRRAL